MIAISVVGVVALGRSLQAVRKEVVIATVLRYSSVRSIGPTVQASIESTSVRTCA